MAFDDLTEEEALALVKISRFNDGKKRKARKMSGKKIKHSKKQKGVFKKPENRKKRDRSNSDNADKILRFGLSNEVSEKEGEEKGPKKIKTTVEPIKDTEDHGQKTKKRRKENHEISNQKQKVVRLAKICGEFLEFAADTSSDYSQKREEFKQYLEKCLTLYGYDILLERVKDGATDYHYSFYHLCLAFNEWDIVEFCEQKRGGQQSALGVLSKGKYHEDDYNGWSLLHRAVFERNISAVEYLCDQERVSGALLNWKTKDKDDQCTALHMAMANFTASFKAMSDTKSIIDTSSAEGCVGDIKIVEELVSPMGRTAIEGHDIDMPDDQGRLPLELVMKESREALMFLLENVDEPTKLRLQKQKEVIEKQVRDSMDDEEAENSTGTEPFSGEDLSMDQSSDHSDSKEEEDYEEELTEHHQQIMKMIQKKTQERKEKEQKASEFIEKLESKNYFNYSDFVNLSEALRLNKQPRSLLISTLGYFVEAFKQENKMSCIFGGGAKVCQMKIAPLEMGKVSALNTKTVKLSDLSEYEQVKNNLQKMIQNQMVTNEEIKQILNCTIFDRLEKVKYYEQILSVDRSIIRDLVLDYLSKWALGMGYQKTSHARPSDSVNSEIDERLACHYQESNPSIESASDTHNIFDLMALHGKGEFIEMLKDLGIDVKRKSKNGNMLHTLLGASSQDNIDEDQVKKLVDIMIEAGAFDQENDQRPSTLDVLLSRNNDSDFIYFLELLLSGLVHAKSVPFIANGIDWDALIQDEKWRKMEKRFNMVNSKLQKGRYSSFFTGGITDKLYNCNENLEAIHGFQSIREKMSDTKDKASHRRKYPMTLERKDHMSGREEGGSSDFDWSEGLESTGWEESEKRLLSVLAEDGETNDLIEAIKNDRVVEVERISHHRNHGPQDWYLEALSVLAEDGETNELIEAIKNDRVVEVERISRHSKDEEVIEKSIWYLAEKEKFRTAHVILLDRLDAGIKIEHILKSKDKNGMTILMRACKAKIRNYKFVDFLLGCGASMEERDNDGNNALMHAAIPPCHNDKLFKELVRKLKGKEQNITKDVSSIICSVNKEGMNILHVLFKNLNSGEDSHATIKALIDMGADINQADRLGNTPLMYACQNNIIREIEKLPREGMDVNKRNKSGMTALMLCNCDSGTKLQAELIKRGARIDIVSEDRETALTLACRNNNHRYVDLLLKKIKDMSDREERRKILNQQGKDGKTALMIAIGFRSLFITRQLLWSNDLNLELHDNMGISALGAACRSANGNCYGNVNANVQAYALLDKIESLEDKEKVRRILNHQEQKSSGKTPLMIAAGLKSDAIIKRLLKYKSELNLELKDHDGRTAWMIANDRKDRKFKNVMDQLRNVEAENVTAENPTSSGFGSTLFGPDDTNTNGTQSQNAKSGDILETDGSVMDGDYKLNDALSFFVDTEANQDEDEEDTKIWEERFKKFQHDF